MAASGAALRAPRPPANPRQKRLRRRSLLQQLAIVAVVAGLLAVLVRNTVDNLQAQGLASGFDFLWQQAGFAVAFSLLPVDAASTYGWIFVVGILNSLLVAALGLVLATFLGFFLGLARVSANLSTRIASKSYVELVRNLPLLLHLLLWQTVFLRALPTVKDAINIGGVAFLSKRGLYVPAPDGGALAWAAAGLALAGGVCLLLATKRWRSVEPEDHGLSMKLLFGTGLASLAAAAAVVDWDVPVLGGFDFEGGWQLMPELVALVGALAIYNASFIAEIVRAGIQSVTRGQGEAAASLGLPPRLVMQLVVVPQALRLVIPPLANQYTHLIKASALATVVGYPDLVSLFLGTTLNQTGRAVEIVVMTAAVYLTLSASVALATGWYERRIRLVER